MGRLRYDPILRAFKFLEGNPLAGGEGITIENVAFKETFVGNGSDTTFQLTGAIQNAVFANGFWKAGRIQNTFPKYIVRSDDGRAVYDSIILNVFTRNRVNILSISSTGLVTTSVAPRSGVNFNVWYWYFLVNTDELDDYVREDVVAEMESDITDIEARKADRRFDYVLVKFLSELPTPSGGVITLAPDTVYEINGDIDVGTDDIKMGEGTVIFSLDRSANTLRGTGAGSFITAEDVTCEIVSIRLEYPNGSLFNFKNTAGNEKTNIVAIRQCDIDNVDDLGTIENLRGFVIRQTQIIDTTTNGLLAIGSQCGDFLAFDNIVVSFTGTLFDLGTSIWDIIHTDRSEVSVPAGQIALDGLASSGNLSVTGFARVTNNNFRDSGTFLSNITKADIQWRFLGNSGGSSISDSVAIGELIVTTPVSTTIIDGTYGILGGTTILQVESERFSQSSNMVLQYDGLQEITVTVQFVASIIKDLGADAEYDMAFHFTPSGGSAAIISKSEQVGVTFSMFGAVNVFLMAEVVLNTGDRIDMRIAGNGTTGPITANTAHMIVK